MLLVLTTLFLLRDSPDDHPAVGRLDARWFLAGAAAPFFSSVAVLLLEGVVRFQLLGVELQLVHQDVEHEVVVEVMPLAINVWDVSFFSLFLRGEPQREPRLHAALVVAAQVAFEKANFEAGFLT
jgi:hypothetical protein